MDADNHETFGTEKDIDLELDNRNHAASVSFQSFIVHLAKADQLHLLQKLFNQMKVFSQLPITKILFDNL